MLKAVAALKLVWTWSCFIFLNGLRGHYDLWLCPTYPSNDKSFFSFSVSLTFWFRRINRIEICAIQHWVFFTTWNHLFLLSKCFGKFDTVKICEIRHTVISIEVFKGKYNSELKRNLKEKKFSQTLIENLPRFQIISSWNDFFLFWRKKYNDSVNTCWFQVQQKVISKEN